MYNRKDANKAKEAGNGKSLKELEKSVQFNVTEHQKRLFRSFVARDAIVHG